MFKQLRQIVRNIRRNWLVNAYLKRVSDFKDCLYREGFSVISGKVQPTNLKDPYDKERKVDLNVQYQTIVWEHQQALKAFDAAS